MNAKSRELLSMVSKWLGCNITEDISMQLTSHVLHIKAGSLQM